MAPLLTVGKDLANTRLNAVLDCANTVHGILKHRSPFPSPLKEELEKHVRRSFSLSHSTVLTGKEHVLDVQGTYLWNASSNLFDLKGGSNLAVLIRVFAFLLLETANDAYAEHTKDRNRQIRLLKIALKTSQLCMDRNELELAFTALERCSDHVAAVCEPSVDKSVSPKIHENNAGDYPITRSLEREYYILRILHCWKSGRLDLADHFSMKLNSGEVSGTKEFATRVANLFHCLGESLSQANKLKISVTWLERALSILDSLDCESRDRESVENYLAISSSLVKVLLAIGDPVSCHRSRQIVDQLQQSPELIAHASAHSLHFDVLAKQQPFEVDQINRVLINMIQSVELSEENARIIIRVVGKAANTSIISALRALHGFIIAKLLPEKSFSRQEQTFMQTLLEKATITYVMLAATHFQEVSKAGPTDLNELLDTISEKNGDAFSAKATHAAQILIWNATNDSQLRTTPEWCELLRHPLFQKSGHLNKAQISRKIMANALENSNDDSAWQAFNEMSPADQNEAHSRYLAFKLALRREDESLAHKSLTVVAKRTGQNPAYLYACILDVQLLKMNGLILPLLQRLLNRRAEGVHLPSILRCTASLLIDETEVPNGDVENFSDIIDVFETAAENVGSIRQVPNTQGRSEIYWWSKTTYTFALRHSLQMLPEELVRLLYVCIRFLDEWKNGSPLTDDEIVGRRKLICFFLSTTALIMQARSEEKTLEIATDMYHEAQQQIQAFNTTHKQLEPLEQSHIDAQRVYEMHKFDLECALKLAQWDRLEDVLRSCLSLQQIECWDSMADLLFVMHADMNAQSHDPHAGALILDVLQKIINETWRRNKDITKVSRWVRLTFTICLDDSESNFSFKMLQQAEGMAAGLFAKDSRTYYPEHELHWLASTSFNRALDLLANEQNDAAHAWMDGAVNLARWAQDNGALYETLQRKRQLALERCANRKTCL